MKILLAVLTGILLFFPDCLAGEGGRKNSGRTMISYRDSGQPEGFFLDSSIAAVAQTSDLGGKPVEALRVTGTTDSYQRGINIPLLFLKAGEDYIAEFQCKVLSAESGAGALIVIRPVDAFGSFSDIMSLTLSETGAVNNVKVPVHVPSGATTRSYTLQIYSKKAASFLVGPITVSQGIMEKLLPVTNNTKPSAEPKVPSGCAEFQIDLPAPQTTLELSVADFGASPDNPDNAKALNDAIASCKERKASKLVVPTGIYRLTGTPAQSLAFKELSDFEFDGRGSTFVFSKDSSLMMSIKSCERVLFKDFNIDWDWERDPLASMITVEDVNTSENFVDFKFVDYEKFPGADIGLARLQQLDPETKSPGCEGALNLSLRDGDALKTEWISGNILRFFMTKNNRMVFSTLKPGSFFRMVHYGHRTAGLFMANNAHLTLSGVSIYSCPGNAYYVTGGQHHWQLLNTKVARPAGTQRPITSTADHCHIAQSRGYFKMENCEMSFGGDDGLNFHACSALGSKTGDKTLTTSNLPPWQSSTFNVGDGIEFRNADYSPTNFTSKIVSIKTVSKKDGIYELNFEDTLPQQQTPFFVLFSTPYDAGNVIVRNSSFHDNYMHGARISGHDITLENNVFQHNEMSAIRIESGYTMKLWCEGYGATNVVVKGNTFDRVNRIGQYTMKPAIFVHVYLGEDTNSKKAAYAAYPILHDILLEGNRFINCPGVITHISSARNIIVRNNTITNKIARMDDFYYRGAAAVTNASDIFVTDNKWVKSPLTPNPGVLYDPQTVKSIFSWGNKVTED